MEEVTLSIEGHEVRIMEGPYLSDRRPTPDALRFAATLIAQLDAMRGFAADTYLDLYNENWRDEEEGDPILDQHGFRARLVNASIVLYDEPGSATIFFDDSGMFAGHSIMISVHGGAVTRASLVG